MGEGKLHQLGSDPFPPVGRLHKYMVDVRDLAVDRREGDKTRPGPVFTEEKDPLFFHNGFHNQISFQGMEVSGEVVGLIKRLRVLALGEESLP